MKGHKKRLFKRSTAPGQIETAPRSDIEVKQIGTKEAPLLIGLDPLRLFSFAVELVKIQNAPSRTNFARAMTGLLVDEQGQTLPEDIALATMERLDIFELFAAFNEIRPYSKSAVDRKGQILKVVVKPEVGNAKH